MSSSPRQRLAGEMVFAVAMVLMSTFLLWTAVGISGFKSSTSAGSFPMAAAFTMLVCSLIVVMQTARATHAVQQDAETPMQRFLRHILPPEVIATTVAIVVYMLLLEQVGFLISSYLFLVVTMWILGSRKFWLNLGVAAGMLAAIYIVFQTAFSVVLPAGNLWQGVFK